MAAARDTVESAAFLTGGGEMGALMRAHDWSTSPLGTPDTWPQSLRTVVQLMLNNRQLMFAAWGEELSFLYNDGYAPTFGAKHPSALGRPFREVWSEIWDDIEPLVARALAGETTYNENLHLVMERNGYPEDAWFTFSYSPLRDDSGQIAGMFCAGIETTASMLAERRQVFRLELEERLRNLADPREIMAAAAGLLGTHLGVGRVGYGEVDESGEILNVERDWTDGRMPSLAGRLRLDDYGAGVTADCRAGRIVRVHDVAADARTSAVLAAYDRIGAPRSGVVVPLGKEGRFRAVLFVHQASPRRWTDGEEALIREVAERTWSAVERARAEAELRESESRYRQIVEGAEDFAIVTLDARGVITNWNTGAERMMGYSQAEALGRDGSLIFTPDDREGGVPVREINRARADGRAVNERWHLRKDGSRFWASGLIMPLVGPGGGYLKIFRDRTAEHEADAAVRESEARLRAMVAAAPFPMMLHAEDGEVVELSRKWTELTGYGRDELRTHFDWGRLAYPDSYERFEAEIAREFLRQGETDAGEWAIRTKDGSTRVWDFHNVGVGRLPDGRRIQISAAADVTERTAAEARLRESEARSRALVNASSDVVYRLSPDLTEMRQLDGRGFLADAVEPSVRWIEESVVPEDRPNVLAVIEEAVRTRTVFELEHRVRRVDGTIGWTFSRAVPVLGDRGEIVEWFGMASDVTERRQAEEALRASEARLAFLDRLGAETAALADADAVLATTTRLLGKHLDLSICAYADMDEDEDGFTIRGDWSAPGSRSIVGHYSLADFGELAVRNLTAGLPLVVNDNLRELAPHEAAAFRNIGIAATICMPLVKEGRLAALMAIHDREPRVWTEAELSLLREVTARSWAHVERVAAVAELRASEARLERALTAGELGAWELDLVELAAWRSPQHDRIFGYEPMLPDWTYEMFLQHVVPDDRDWVDAAFQEAMAVSGRWDFECRIRRADGEPRWIWAQGRVESGEDERPARMKGMVRDVTERKRTEERLRELNETLESRVADRTAELAESERRFRAIFDTTFQLTGLGTLDGTLLVVNQAALDAVHARQEQVAGTKMWDAPWWASSPDEAGRVREGVARVAAGEFVRYESTLELPDGRRVFDFSMKPVLDDEGKPILIVAEGRDITEFKITEEALRQSQKLESMGQLTGGVAHDFNNLLTPIIGSLDMLVRRGVGSERERRLIDGALQSAERAKTLVQRLLAFARRQPLQPTSVDLARLVDGMAGLIDSTLGPTIEVRMDLADDLPPGKADPNQLEMALLNLAVNARDAMPGGGEFTIAATRENVRAGHKSNLKPGHYVRLRVADTGVGMDEATRKRAIEPFFSTKGIGKGTGLGLSMVHGLAAQLGGGLAIESAPGKGTTIDLWLPVSAGPIGSEVEAIADTPARVGRGTALLVDDEDLLRMSTADMLVDLGFEVIEAASGEEAVQIIKSGTTPDLLVTDHLMPGMTGADLAREARRLNPALPVLIVSGYAEVDGIAPDLPRLTKPFRNAELAASVAALITTAGP